MRIWIDADEEYPVYTFGATGVKATIEVDAEACARWERVFAEYQAVQEELAALSREEHRRWLESIKG